MRQGGGNQHVGAHLEVFVVAVHIVGQVTHLLRPEGVFEDCGEAGGDRLPVDDELLVVAHACEFQCELDGVVP